MTLLTHSMRCAIAAMITFLAGLQFGCSAPPYEWRTNGPPFVLVEKGHRATMQRVLIRETSNPANAWTDVIVEQSDDIDDDDISRPRWPADRRAISTTLLERLNSRMPRYRYTANVTRAVETWNPEIGTFRTAWMVRLNPLAIAFTSGPPEIPPAVRTRINQMRDRGDPRIRETSPGYFEVRMNGGVTVTDLRTRTPAFVTAGDWTRVVDHVLLFPAELPLPNATGRSIEPTSAANGLKSRVVKLKQPMRLGNVIDAIARDAKWEPPVAEVEMMDAQTR